MIERFTLGRLLVLAAASYSVVISGVLIWMLFSLAWANHGFYIEASARHPVGTQEVILLSTWLASTMLVGWRSFNRDISSLK